VGNESVPSSFLPRFAEHYLTATQLLWLRLAAPAAAWPVSALFYLRPHPVMTALVFQKKRCG
jgi:hypothetical protein